MENASKALIIAGSILITMLVISLGIIIFNQMGGAAKEQANMSEQEISAFNSKITPYLGENVSGSQVNALIQIVIGIDNAAVSSQNLEQSVEIKFPKSDNSGSYIIQIVDNGGNPNVDIPAKRVPTGASEFYKVEADYGRNGLISKIVVSK